MAEKTEKPTPKKLKDARKKGEVVRSKDVVETAVFAALLAALWFGGGYWMTRLDAVVEFVLAQGAVAAPQRLPLAAVVERVGHELLWLLLPFCAIALVAGVVGAFAQVRALFSLEPVTMKFERINPASGLQNLFSSRQFFELMKMLVKAGLLVGALSLVIMALLQPALRSAYIAPAEIGLVARDMILQCFGWAAAIYLIDSAIDYGHQYYEFMKRQKMSHEEIRREYKDMEGDPLVKGRRQALAREMAAEPMLDKVPRASVVVTNPTHVAVALYYKSGETDLPVVVAKGADALALRIRDCAKRAGVPILENRVLARQLYAEVALDDFIGENFVEAVAEVFRWVRRLHQQGKVPRAPAKHR